MLHSLKWRIFSNCVACFACSIIFSCITSHVRQQHIFLSSAFCQTTWNVKINTQCCSYLPHTFTKCVTGMLVLGGYQIFCCQVFDLETEQWQQWSVPIECSTECPHASLMSSDLAGEKPWRLPWPAPLWLALLPHSPQAILSSLLVGFLSHFPTFLCSGVFFCAFMALGYGTVMYCWMMEHADGKVKTILGAAPHYNFGFWGLMTAVIAYCVPDWRHMQLIFSLPLVLLFGAFWVMPESARYPVSMDVNPQTWLSPRGYGLLC